MMRFLRTAKKKDLAGVALVRLDFNTKDGDWRMKPVVPTLATLIKTSRAIVIVSHRGRPFFAPHGGATKGKSDFTISVDKDLSLRKDATVLSRLIKKKVIFIEHFDFEKIKAQIAESPRGSIFLLENIRFIEENNTSDMRFIKRLASLGDFYVNDAFAVDHRSEASITGLPKVLPSYVGFELEQEIQHLTRIMQSPRQPMVAIFGGVKAEDKLGVLRVFQKKATWVLLGGGCANTILSLRGMDVKNSVRDTDPESLRALKSSAGRHNVIAPVDYVWHKDRVLDIGPASIKDFSKIIAGAKTILWSGPIGMTEDARYAKGTLGVVRAIIKNKKAFSVAGGGETVAFLKKHRLDKKFGFISIGGGALLDFLAGKKLPGIEALKKATRV